MRGRSVRRGRVHRARHPRVRPRSLELQALCFAHTGRPRRVARREAHPVLGANVRGGRGHHGRDENRSRQDLAVTT